MTDKLADALELLFGGCTDGCAGWRVADYLRAPGGIAALAADETIREGIVNDTAEKITDAIKRNKPRYSEDVQYGMYLALILVRVVVPAPVPDELRELAEESDDD